MELTSHPINTAIQNTIILKPNFFCNFLSVLSASLDFLDFSNFMIFFLTIITKFKKNIPLPL